MEATHYVTLPEDQLQSLWHIFQRPSRSKSGNCSLCGRNATSLKSHLSRHLEQLALFAIPQTNYMLDLDIDDLQSDKARLSCDIWMNSRSSDKQSSEVPEKSTENMTDGHVDQGTDSEEDETKSLMAEEETIPDLQGDLDGIDTSWDQITSKFHDARASQSSYEPDTIADTIAKSGVESELTGELDNPPQADIKSGIQPSRANVANGDEKQSDDGGDFSRYIFNRDTVMVETYSLPVAEVKLPIFVARLRFDLN